MKRRTLLSVAGAVSAGGLAGCLSSLGDSGTELLGVVASNQSTSQQSVEIRVLLDGESVEETGFTLDATTAESLACSWPDEPGEFVVEGRFEGEDGWNSYDVADADSECAYVYVIVHHIFEEITFAVSGEDCEHPGSC